MTLKKNRQFFLGAMLIMMIFFAIGCGKKETVKDTPAITSEVTPSPSPKVTVEVTSTPTPTPTQLPKNTNPLSVEGYQPYEEENTIDHKENIRLLASVEDGAKIGDDFVSDLTILSYSENYILVSYVTAAEQMDFMEESKCKQHLTLISADTLEPVKQLELDGNFYVYRTEHVIALEIYKNPGWIIKTYDYELNEVAVMDVPGDSLGTYTSDGKRCYYVADKKIYALNGENNVSKEVTANENFLVDYISGVLSDDFGNDYVVFWGMAADYKEYQFILNVSTGDVMHVQTLDEKYSEITNNTYMECFMGDYYPSHWLFGISQDKALDFEWKGESTNITIYTLKNRNKLFVYARDSVMYFFLYDYETGDLLGATSFDVSQMWHGNNELGGTQVYIYETPIYTEENALILPMINMGSTRFWVEWDLSLDEKDAENMAVTEHQMGSSPSVDISEFYNPLYTPGELSENLKPLREKADELEEKYGIGIYIGEECSNIIGNYAVAPMTEYSVISYMLELLDKEMARYPDNFFEQFTYSWIDGLDIYLAGTLTGISEDTLDYAGGFKTIYGSRIALVIDCYDSHNAASTFHHELCHAMEEKIVESSYSQEEPLFNETTWNSFNPQEDMYTYTYEEWGNPKYWEYSYEQYAYGNGEAEDTYFIDMYAMTYPKEDRARIFESVMSDHRFDVDFEKTPHLVEKMNYFARCIREVFDTTGWEDVPWEMYME